MPAHSSGAASSAGKIVGHGRHRLGRDDHVFRVAAVVADSGNLLELAENEMAAPAGIAGEAMSAMPADADALAGLPLRDVGANRVDASGNLMAGNARVLQSGKARLLYDGVAVADAAGFNLDPNLGAARLRNRTFDDFEVSTGFADLCGFHDFFLRSTVMRLVRNRCPGYRPSRWANKWRRCRNAYPGAPSSSLRFLERQGGEVGTGPCRCRTSEGARAYISYLYLSAMKSPMD